MRTLLLAGTSILALGLTAWLSARSQEETVKVRLRLVDADSGAAVGGIVRVFGKDADKPLLLAGLYPRLRGLPKMEATSGWQVVPAEGAETTLPKAALKLEAVSGLETALTRQDLDAAAAPKEITVKLRYLFRPEKLGLAAGNTHLHLRGFPLEEADQYLKKIPAADGLKVMFISYLERNKDDVHYITNRYPVGDLKQFDSTGVLVNNGEEHRHNFEGFGQGYGHVMLLGLQRLVKPVSIGPGITGAGFDEPGLTPGILDAKGQGGTIIWCHNTNGFEAVPNALAGRLDALNVFDGSRSGSYEDRYYRFLNVGLRLPISTGTDWFMYDFSRVYAKPQGKLSVQSWLDAVKAGRCSATNGPLLSLTVDGKEPGDVLQLNKPKTMKIEASALGRHNFTKLELVHNGKVIHTQAAEAKDDHYAARFSRAVNVDGPAWFAVRIDSPTRNEFDARLYAHSSPVYVDFAGQRVFDLETARGLLKYLEQAQAEIKAKGKFAGDDGAKKVLALYEQAAKELTEQVNRRGK